jgi:hypothetical protein
MKYVYAFAKLHKGRTGQQWIVQQCPFCTSLHYHGAGKTGEDAVPFLGDRVAHCFGGGHYVLTTDDSLNGMPVEFYPTLREKLTELASGREDEKQVSQ